MILSHALSSVAMLFALAAPSSCTQQTSDAVAHAPEAPATLYEVERVVDGDTIWIRRNGGVEKLRLLSVDTEEKLSFQGSTAKPGTVFGEETTLWAQAVFDELAAAEPDGIARVGLAFPDDVEACDVYGRLLCHVILPDGSDFNLRLVREGKSPYFNKYGNSRIAHDAFVAAQAAARAAKIGIWDPATNAPRTADAPTAERPYDRLLPWWELRARAVDRFRAQAERTPLTVVAADDPAALARAFEHVSATPIAERPSTRVFALVERVFDEKDGSLTVLLRSGAKDAALRFVIAPSERSVFREVDFEGFNRTYEQNYAWFEGPLEPGPRGGWVIRGRSLEQVERAMPRSAHDPAATEAGAQR